MALGDIADRLTRGVESAGGALGEAFFEPVMRLGVTGLSRSGKTVFITSLVANLLDRGRMPQLVAAAEGRILTAYLQPQPDDTVPRFDYETHLAALTAPEPRWPESTRAISELRLSLRVRPAGLLAGLRGPRTLHVDIVDYPGEWLLDLGLLDKSYPPGPPRRWNGPRVRPGGDGIPCGCRGGRCRGAVREADSAARLPPPSPRIWPAPAPPASRTARRGGS